MAASLTSPLGNAFSNKYAEELIQTARAIAAPGKGILAADESTGTIGKRVSAACSLRIWQQTTRSGAAPPALSPATT
jgi:hypothetical protein